MSKSLMSRAEAGDPSAQFKVARRLWIPGRRARSDEVVSARR